MLVTNRVGSKPAADNYRLADLVDLSLIQRMVDAHYRAAGMPMGIIDALDGSILVGAGWQEICVKFHRANPASLRRCEESDNYIKSHLTKGKTCAYKCANGLWDIGIPIIVANRHLATMFLGQFFYEGEFPDREFFKQQAHGFGYAMDDYLAALDRVPVFSHEKVDYILAYNNALAGFIADIAEHALWKIKADKELRFVNAVLKAQQEKSLDGILVVNDKQEMISFNNNFVKMWDIPPHIVESESNEQAMRSVQRILAHPDKFMALIKSVYEHPDRTIFGEVALKDGRIFEQYSAPMFGSEGTYYGRVWYFRDITERKRAEETLKASQQLFSTIFHISPVAMAITALDDGRIYEVNGAFEKLFGIARNEAIGHTSLETGVYKNAEEWQKLARAMCEQGTLHDFEITLKRKDGSPITGVMSATQIVIGQKRHILSALVDITGRKRIEEERLAYLRFLESMDRVNRAVQGTNDLEKIMGDVFEIMLSIFGSDSAWLVYPCDPNASSWRVQMERTRPEYPCALEPELEMPMDPDTAKVFQTTRKVECPVTFGNGSDYPLAGEVPKRFQEQSRIAMTLYPKADKPWLLGMRQCSYPRVWTQDEKSLFQEIGRRLGSVLTSLLIFRNLQESETKYRRIVDTANEGIWMIGEDLKTTFINTRMAEILGYRAEEIDGLPMAAFMFEEDVPDYLRKMEDCCKRRFGNYERRFRRKDGQMVWTMVSAAPIFDDGKHFKGSFAMFTDITERKRMEEELQASYGKLQRSFAGIINAITMIVETRDPYTAGHQKRVSLLATAMAEELGLPDERLHNIGIGASLHDIGKIYVPAEILSKPTAISPLERNIIRLHPQGGYDILKNIEFPWSVAQIALQHQERFDGSGYPRGLAGNDILFDARIVSVADVVEAMTFNRPYREAIGKEKALEEIAKGRGILYDPDAVDACIELFRDKNFSFK